MKIAAQSYNEVGSLSNLKHQITVKTEAGKSAKQSAVKLEHRMKDLAEIIKYAEQYKTNRSYHIAYKKSKNPDAYFRRYESPLILYGGARRVLEQTGICLLYTSTASSFSCFYYSLMGSICLTKLDVIFNRICKKINILEYHTDILH